MTTDDEGIKRAYFTFEFDRAEPINIAHLVWSLAYTSAQVRRGENPTEISDSYGRRVGTIEMEVE